jgi:hypothetical protein
MSDNKCQNEGCGAHMKGKIFYSTNCYFDRAQDCPKFTTTPTTTIPTAELEALKKDRARLEFVQNHTTGIHFDDVSDSLYYGDPAHFAKVDWLREAIDKAMQEKTDKE